SLAVFFIQAEDGIRDRNVTGVQTCALPIFAVFNLYQDIAHFIANITQFIEFGAVTFGDDAAVANHHGGVIFDGFGEEFALCWERSEERRGGEECGAGVSGGTGREAWEEVGE